MRMRSAALGLVLWMSAAPVCLAAPAESASEEPPAAPPDLPRSAWSTGDDSASLAPVGVTDARTLHRGGWAFSYRYTWIHGDDMRDSTHRESTGAVLQNFSETPRSRDEHVHLLGISYAPHERVTLSAKLPFITQETHHVDRSARRFDTESSGVGDLELRVLWQSGHAA